jgi:hypothetical protein
VQEVRKERFPSKPKPEEVSGEEQPLSAAADRVRAKWKMKFKLGLVPEEQGGGIDRGN